MKENMQEGAPTYEQGRLLWEKAEACGDPQLYNEAERVFWEGEQRGDAKCCYGMALCLYHGRGVEESRSHVLQLIARYAPEWERLADEGDPEAMIILYECWDRYFPAPDTKKALGWLQRAVDAGSARACYLMAGRSEAADPVALLDKAYRAGFHLSYYAKAQLAFFGYYLHTPADCPNRRTVPVDANAILTHLVEMERHGDPRHERTRQDLAMLYEGFRVWEGRLIRYTGKEREIGQLTVPDGVTEIMPGALAGYRIDALTLPATMQDVADDLLDFVGRVDAPKADVPLKRALDGLEKKRKQREHNEKAAEKAEARRIAAENRAQNWNDFCQWFGEWYAIVFSVVFFVLTAAALIFFGCTGHFHFANLAMIITCSILAAAGAAWWIVTLVLLNDEMPWMLPLQAALTSAQLLAVFFGGAANPFVLFPILFGVSGLLVIAFTAVVSEEKLRYTFITAAFVVVVLAIVMIVLAGSIYGFSLTNYVKVDKDTGMEIVRGSYGWHITATAFCVFLTVAGFVGAFDTCSSYGAVSGSMVLMSSLWLALSATILFFGELMGGFTYLQFACVIGSFVGGSAALSY